MLFAFLSRKIQLRIQGSDARGGANPFSLLLVWQWTDLHVFWVLYLFLKLSERKSCFFSFWASFSPISTFGSFRLLRHCRYTKHNWKPHSCDGPSYLRIDGPGQYPFFTDSSVDRDKCQLWGYKLWSSQANLPGIPVVAKTKQTNLRGEREC